MGRAADIEAILCSLTLEEKVREHIALFGEEKPYARIEEPYSMDTIPSNSTK
jgi:hypothetical protein